jgi:hypothetical protein
MGAQQLGGDVRCRSLNKTISFFVGRNERLDFEPQWFISGTGEKISSLGRLAGQGLVK